MQSKKVKNDIFKLNYVKVKNRYNKYHFTYIHQRDMKTIETYREIQVNSKKFINYFLINVKDRDILDKLEKLKIPLPNKIIYNNFGQQLFYKLTNPLNIYNSKIKSYYNAIFNSLLKHLKVEKDNENLFMKNMLNTKMYQTKDIHDDSYSLGDFKHLIIKDSVLSFKKDNGYDFINNYIFNYVKIYSLKNTFLVLNKGKIVIENKTIEVAGKLKQDEKDLSKISMKDLMEIADKIYKYIVDNQDELLKKYGNRGRYRSNVATYKTLKKKQQVSGKLSAKRNAKRNEDLVCDAIRKLLGGLEKITVKKICESAGVSNKTVLKYYRGFIDRIKGHNEEVKGLKELEGLLW
jgi:hypothetical protein